MKREGPDTKKNPQTVGCFICNVHFRLKSVRNARSCDNARCCERAEGDHEEMAEGCPSHAPFLKRHKTREISCSLISLLLCRLRRKGV